jgi:hypothetical protein
MAEAARVVLPLLRGVDAMTVTVSPSCFGTAATAISASAGRGVGNTFTSITLPEVGKLQGSFSALIPHLIPAACSSVTVLLRCAVGMENDTGGIVGKE